MSHFVGRTEALTRLVAAYEAAIARSAGPAPAGLVLVTGEAGIGKSTLLAQFAGQVAARGGQPVWGTCWEGEQAPAFWPWTQALRVLLAERPGLRDAVDLELATVVPELDGTPPSTPAADPAGRLRVFDAAVRLLGAAATANPVLVLLDDLQWADRSTLDLLRFAAGQCRTGALLLVGSYRSNETAAEVTAAFADLAPAAELVALPGLAPGEVADLVEAMAGADAAARWARVVHEKSGGHPFFAREVCRLLASGGSANAVPSAVRQVIDRRLTRLSAHCAALLGAAAVAGTNLLPDVLADVCDDDPIRVAELMAEAREAGVLAPADEIRFAHDLYRESIYAALPARRRLELHERVAAALLRRHERGNLVFPAELARHFSAAVPLAGTGPAVVWGRAAAEADATRFAFAEAAGHLARVRTAAAEAGDRLADPVLVDLLTGEADLWLRSGDAGQARHLLDLAWTRAVATGQGDLIGAVALGLDRVGARFAMPRTKLVDALDRARIAVEGMGTAIEAQVLAALARQLQHSVPADRPRARPLAERAVAIARPVNDLITLASCLLAHHDTLWTPGTATQRAAISSEIADLAQRAGDPERRAQALLLSATAQLENGSPAFRATLAEYAYLTEGLRQPRHDYLLRSRQAALALLDGDIDAGARLSAEAAALGEAIGDSDAGNVRMSQGLEIVRARGDVDELRAMAAEAVTWWVGAPAHAHAVAAGFSARAGDLETARRELDTVLALDDWRTDRSYLWSIFVSEMAAAAIALHDRPLCQRLLSDLLPVAESCAVNGALVCFMGAHAHRVGLLYATLDQPDLAREWLRKALDTHRRLGAAAWAAETRGALASLGEEAPEPAHAALGPAPAASDIAQLRQVGDMWLASYRGRSAYLRDVKGLHDLAAMLARPGVDLPAVELAGGEAADRGHRTNADPVLDRTALLGYRRRLAELDEELDDARSAADLARTRRATDEREQLLAELRRATRPDGSPRPLGSTVAERARKAVTARVRDAIRRIGTVLPEMGGHLDRTIRTGVTCRYDAPPPSGLRA